MSYVLISLIEFLNATEMFAGGETKSDHNSTNNK